MVFATILVMANLLSFHFPLFVDDCLRTLESGAALIVLMVQRLCPESGAVILDRHLPTSQYARERSPDLD